jgi:hypothetical protein
MLTDTPIHVSGGVFKCPVTNQLLFLCEISSDEMKFLTTLQLGALLLRGIESATVDELDVATLTGLWSIGTIQDVRASTVLSQTAKNAIERSLAEARSSGVVRWLTTQGLTRQLLRWSKDSHPFGHPSVRERAVCFEVHPDAVVQMVPELNELLPSANLSPENQKKLTSYVKFLNKNWKSMDRGMSVAQMEKELFERTEKRAVAQNKKATACGGCGYVALVKACSRCRKVAYCSVSCQTSDWNVSHRHTCRVLQGRSKKQTPV